MEDKILAMLPKEKEDPWANGYNVDMTTGFNECLSEVHALVPAIIEKLYEELRGKVDRLDVYYRSKYSRDCSRGETAQEISTEMVDREALLSLLSTKK